MIFVGRPRASLTTLKYELPAREGIPVCDDASEARWIPLDEVESLECTPRFVETMTAWGVLAQ